MAKEKEQPQAVESIADMAAKAAKSGKRCDQSFRESGLPEGKLASWREEFWKVCPPGKSKDV